MTQVLHLTTALAALTFSATEPVIGNKIRRPARLFVAGDYPDKGVTITPDDLGRIVANFGTAKNPVPVKTEHTDTVLDPLGEVSALYVDGDELYGVLTFSVGMDSHIRERGVEHLSVALLREEDGSFRLKETSLVFTPRVANAGFLTRERIAATVAKFAGAGKITPAMRPVVERLLSLGCASTSDAPQVVTFGDGSSVNVAAEVEALLCALPVVQPRGSVGAAGFGGVPADGPSAATRQFAELFGVDVGKIHAHLKGVSFAP